MHSLPTESDFDTRFRGRFAVERSPILTEIDVYLRKVVELRTRLNTFTDINQLPTELLAKIFVAYAQDHYQSTICDRTSRSTGPHWIKLAHVVDTGGRSPLELHASGATSMLSNPGYYPLSSHYQKVRLFTST